MRLPVFSAAALAAAASAYAAFTPIALDPASYNQDVVVELSAQPGLLAKTTASIDGGTNNTGSTWYEVGHNPDFPDSGLPAAGSTWTSVSSPNYTFKMAPSYIKANNAVLIDTVVTNATLTLATPAAYSALSFVGSGGNGGGVISVTVHHQDGSTETGSFNCPDWFGGANPAWIAYGRANAQNFGFDTQGSITDPGNPRLYSRDVPLSNTTSPIVKIDLNYSSGGANVHNGIFAVSGATSSGGAFTPIDVTGYNYDMIIEASAPRPQPLNATTASMDSGLNNTGNTWYEEGYNPDFPTTGLPPAGSTVINTNAPDHSYSLPPSYLENNAVFVDPNSPLATITLASPAAYTALSFLAAAGNGPGNITATIYHADGSSETAPISVPDWFNAANPVYTVNGRVNVDSGVFANLNGNNPRVYGIDVPLANTTSPVTAIDLFYDSTGGRAVILGLSGNTGALAPIFTTQPASVRVNPGENVVLSAVASGTEPLTYQWQKNSNGEFVDVTNGAGITGATTGQLTLTSVNQSADGQYRLVVSNAGGTVNSSVVTVTVISPLTDVTQPGDAVTLYNGSTPGAEGVEHAIDDLTSKYLNFGANGAAPFVGPVGLEVTPSSGRTIVTGLRFYTANDAVNRDPADYKLEGSNDGGNTYTEISSGPLALPSERNTGGNPIDPLSQNLQQVLFANTSGYTTYRLSFNTVKAPTTDVFQLGEVEFLGVADSSGSPSVTRPTPVTATAAVGGTAQFSINFTGVPAPSIRWQRSSGSDYVNLSDSANVAGATTATLTLNNLTTADAGNFRAIVSNSSGSVTSAPSSLRIISNLADVTSPFDTIEGFGDTTIGAPNGPGATEPYTAFDDSFTKYLNGGAGFNAQAGFPPFEGPVGLVVTPAAGSTIVSGIRFYAADGNTERDPADYKLEGSNDGTTFTEISSGALDLPARRNAPADFLDPLTSSMQEVLFQNNLPFNIYRITFNNARNNSTANSVQIGELELLGILAEGAPPALSITHNSDGTLTIASSAEGTLQSTTALGPNAQWTDEGPISGSTTITPATGATAKFYRVQTQ